MWLRRKIPPSQSLAQHVQLVLGLGKKQAMRSFPPKLWLTPNAAQIEDRRLCLEEWLKASLIQAGIRIQCL
ncbi:RPA1 [Symbiodinium natans]|uniref:RPA1 protein n=1 Tax=Symbiodinium natans TaxID=878477 RepID=A0A812S6K0_9DINO|nr:RPA1 [Symbiodinium natans]